LDFRGKTIAFQILCFLPIMIEKLILEFLSGSGQSGFGESFAWS